MIVAPALLLLVALDSPAATSPAAPASASATPSASAAPPASASAAPPAHDPLATPSAPPATPAAPPPTPNSPLSTPALALSASTTQAVAPSAPAPAAQGFDAETCLQDPPACVTTAGAHFDAGRFTDAVRLFEALAAAHPEVPKYHYFAGLARESAGDDTAAYVHMRRFLASEADNPNERKRATRRTVAILARTIKVSLRTPKHSEPLTLRLKRTGATHTDEPPILVPLAALSWLDSAHVLALTPGEWELSLDPARFGENEVRPLRITVAPAAQTLKVTLTPVPIRHELTLDLGPSRALRRGITLELRSSSGPSLSFTTEAASVRRELPPGTWTYEARARGFFPQMHTLELDGPAILPVQLVSKWTEDRRKRLKLGLGLAGAGLATGIAGAVLITYADHRLKHSAPEPKDGEPPVREPALVAADIGSGLLGATLGLWIGATSSASHSRRLWLTEAALGAASAAGGAVWFGIRSPHSRGDHEHALAPSLGANDPQALVATGLIGLGASVLTSAVVHLASIKQKKTLASKRIQTALSSASARISIAF